MAANLVISPLNPVSTKLFSSSFQPQPFFPSKIRKTQFRISANIGVGFGIGRGRRRRERAQERRKEEIYHQRRGTRTVLVPQAIIGVLVIQKSFKLTGVCPLHQSWYWQTAGERKGENPMKTPLPYIIIFGMSTPFVILAIAFANGWVKVPVR